MKAPDLFPRGVFLLNSDKDLDACGIDTRELSNFINTLAGRASEHLFPKVQPGSLDVVVVVRTRRRSRVWFVHDQLAGEDLVGLKEALEEAPAPHISSGWVGFALLGRKLHPPAVPLPEEWSAIPQAEQRSMGLGEIVDRVWPDESKLS